MLLMRLALPILNDIVSKNVLQLLASLNLGSVADQFGHGTSPSDVVLEDMDKFFVSLHGINIVYHGLSTNKELCCSDPTINCWCVRVYSISCYWFIPTVNNVCLYLFFRYLPIGIW